MAKELSGILFKNDKKTKDTHPVYKGSAMLNGIEYWIAGWLNEGDKGKYMSLKFEKKENISDKYVPTPQQRKQADDEAEIPF